MARGRTESVMARRVGGRPPSAIPARDGRQPHEVLVEEPLEIRLGDDVVATTMRTPGHDFELAVGWCWSEGLVSMAPSEVRYCATGSAVDTEFNVVSVAPAESDPVTASPPPARLGVIASSCGICGADQLDRLTERLEPLPPGPPLPATLIGTLHDAVGPGQTLFALTGGSHAAAAVRVDGTVAVVREDIGRHNAVDKVVGRLALDGGLPSTGTVLWVSGRASFEIVQKAWAAGFAALVAVGAPSALAVSTAAEAGMVLCAFARDGRFTVYAGDDAVVGADRGGVPT